MWPSVIYVPQHHPLRLWGRNNMALGCGSKFLTFKGQFSPHIIASVLPLLVMYDVAIGYCYCNSRIFDLLYNLKCLSNWKLKLLIYDLFCASVFRLLILKFGAFRFYIYIYFFKNWIYIIVTLFRLFRKKHFSELA